MLCGGRAQVGHCFLSVLVTVIYLASFVLCLKVLKITYRVSGDGGQRGRKYLAMILIAPTEQPVSPTVYLTTNKHCPHCGAEGLREWQEKPVQAHEIRWFVWVSIVAVASACLPVAIVWFVWLINRKRYHFYCPACEATQ